jgi:hypothetical protein
MDVFISNARVRLSDANLLGEGGEARVYRAGDRAVKLFHTPSAERAKKLAAFPKGLPEEIVAPKELVHDKAGAVIGYAMPAVLGHEELARLANRRWREGAVSNAAVSALFEQLGDVLARLHGLKVVVGDLNDGNVLFAPGAQRLALIDADSMQFGGYACAVAHERTLDPVLYGRALDFTVATDWYAWNVLLFSSLLYVHPYGGVHKALPTLLRRGEARHSILKPDVAWPRGAQHARVLSDDVLHHFSKVFDGAGRTRAPKLEWKKCDCGVEHARAACPECKKATGPRQALRSNGRCTARTIFSTPGRVLEVALRGGVRYVYEESGVVRREDGSLVLDGPAAPGMRFAIDGASTWVADRLGRLTCVRGGRSADRASTGVRGTVPVFSPTYRLEQEWIVEHHSGSRVGQILEGQTWLWSGERLGLTLYRAGGMTHVFLLRPGRAGLLPVRAPVKLSGRLVEASCVFDDSHALLSVVTERVDEPSASSTSPSPSPMRSYSELWLFDANGQLLRHGEGPGRGRALFNGRIVCATDDGLLSLGATPTLFPDSQEFVGADDALFAQPDGSLIVASTQDIIQLSLSP